MADPNNWNESVIKEFRANGGKVAAFGNGSLLLLTSTGAKTGKRFTTPVVYRTEGDRMVIFASKAGAPTNPDWYHNLVANPRATVEVGTETFDVDAEVLTGEERDRIWQRQAQEAPGFAEYQTKTTRIIPVIALTRVR